MTHSGQSIVRAILNYSAKNERDLSTSLFTTAGWINPPQ